MPWRKRLPVPMLKRPVTVEAERQAAVRIAYADALQSLETERRATVHPLGVLTFAQVRDASGGYSRLHLWQRERVRLEIPHSHSGDLRSTILVGALASTTWQLSSTSSLPVS